MNVMYTVSISSIGSLKAFRDRSMNRRRLARETMLSTCMSHLRSSWTITPRIFVCLTRLSFWPQSEMSGSGTGALENETCRTEHFLDQMEMTCTKSCRT